MIDNRDFLATKRRAETDVLLPAGLKVAFTSGLDFKDQRAIWDRLDKVHAKHPDMVLRFKPSLIGIHKSLQTSISGDSSGYPNSCIS
jgi:hypothetical protein